jgi:hypothetical protein
MKNKYIEHLKRSAKLHHRNSRTRNFDNGIVVRHLYNEKHPEKFSWWDDVIFVLNDYLVNVSWQHPRHVYKDKAEEAAFEACAPLRKPSDLDLFADATPNYRKVGKSRKKIVSYTHNGEDQSEYYDALRKEEACIVHDPGNNIVVTPNMSLEWTNWSRFVSICMPIEIRGVDDLHKLVDITKRLLKREITLETEFGGYTYTQKNWIAEFDKSTEIGLLSHAVNGRKTEHHQG